MNKLNYAILNVRLSVMTTDSAETYLITLPRLLFFYYFLVDRLMFIVVILKQLLKERYKWIISLLLVTHKEETILYFITVECDNAHFSLIHSSSSCEIVLRILMKMARRLNYLL